MLFLLDMRVDFNTFGGGECLHLLYAVLDGNIAVDGVGLANRVSVRGCEVDGESHVISQRHKAS